MSFSSSKASAPLGNKASIEPTGNNKVLIITYYWPPSGGAGVQRWLKFAKYLPDSGCEPVILTIDPEYAAYPVTDMSLSLEVPKSLKVYKTPATDYFSIYRKDRSKIPSAGFAGNPGNSFKDKIFRFIRGNFFIPDPRKGWNRYAFRKACSLIADLDIRNLITTSPPHSTQLIGLKLKEKYPGINWIADLRDPWTDIYYYNQFYPTPLSRAIDSSYEKRVLRSADRIITVGETLKKSFIQKSGAPEDKFAVITNGFDEEDFTGDFPVPEKFTVTYVGTLSDSYPAAAFLDAFSEFLSAGNEALLRFVGTVTPTQMSLIESKVPSTSLQFIPYCDHSEAIGYMMTSSALLLIIPGHPGNKSIITGKLFEYMASGKPVICLGPVDGDAAGIIKEAEAGRTFDYDDPRLVRSFLDSLISGDITIQGTGKKRFSRKALTKSLSEVLNIVP